MTDNTDSISTASGNSTKDLAIRGALVVLAVLAVMFPLVDVPSAVDFTGSEIMHPRILGLAAFLIPGAYKAAEEAPLSIAEAKRRLAATFGVSPDNIKITVEG